MRFSPVIVSLAIGLPVLAQTDVQWTNAAGGSFFDGANWAGGVVPDASQNARFALPGTYTVTGGQPWDVVQVFVPTGDVTLAIFGETGVRAYAMEFGTVGAVRTVVRAPARIYSRSSGTLIWVRNADFYSAGVWGHGLRVLDGSSATFTGNMFDASMSVHVDAASLLRCDNVDLFYANNLQSSGRIEVVDSYLSLNAMNQTGGSIHAINSEISADGVGAQGGVYTFVDSLVRSNIGALNLWLAGEVVFRGSQAEPRGFVELQSGRLSLLQGATSPLNVRLIGESTLYVGSDSSAMSVSMLDESIVRISGQGTIGSSQPSGNRLFIATLGTVEFELDALVLPGWAPVLARDVAGRLAVDLQHANSLQIGQEVPLIARDLSAGVFSSVDLPVLHGGRALELVYEPTLVSLRVVADSTNPCWTADFDGDGDTGTDADIEAFFACLAGNCCPACGRADFDGDGDSGTDADIEAFFRVLAGGSC